MPTDARPFLPYGRQEIDEEDVAAVVKALRADFLTTGPAVAAFEGALIERTGARFAVAVSSGTAALHAACFAAGVREGDEVVVPAITFLATANCARYLGAEPVFADVDPDTGLVTREEIERKVSRRTRAVIPVDLTGRPADLAGVSEVARSCGAALIEDAAHSLGASYDGQPIGSSRHAAMTTLSFHPVKHVTTGEGGAILTNDERLAHLLRCFRNHGMVREGDGLPLENAPDGPWYYEQQFLGFNYRITDVQCALGLSQLAKLDRFLERRRALAARYDRLLCEASPLVRPVCPGEDAGRAAIPAWRSAYHLYAVLIDFEALGKRRADVVPALRSRGIGTQVHYIPVPFQPYYRARGARPEEFPGARRYSERTLSLPLFASMSEGDVDRVVDALAEVLSLPR